MKHVLIPTDFTISSLQPIHTAVHSFPGEKIKITLLHLLEMPSGIGDLLIRAAKKTPAHLINSDFQHACEIIKNKYASDIASINTIFRYGHTSLYTETLCEVMQVDAVIINPEYQLSLPHHSSIDMVPLLKKSGCRIIKMNTPMRLSPMEQVSFGSLLLKDNNNRQKLSNA